MGEGIVPVSVERWYEPATEPRGVAPLSNFDGTFFTAVASLILSVIMANRAGFSSS